MSHSHCLGSSPSKLPIVKNKIDLKKQIIKLDKKLSEFSGFTSKIVIGIKDNETSGFFRRSLYPKEYERLLSLDQKRKKVRNKLKGVGGI